MRPYLEKYLTHKRAGGVAQVIECLPSKCEALSSNPSTEKKKKKGRERERERNWDEVVSHGIYYGLLQSFDQY
jgi:hypothetical protein